MACFFAAPFWEWPNGGFQLAIPSPRLQQESSDIELEPHYTWNPEAVTCSFDDETLGILIPLVVTLLTKLVRTLCAKR